MLSIGIVGLPNAGKSTLFQALTRKKVAIAVYPFTTVDPNKALVSVPDERLQKLAELVESAQMTPATIEFIDIAGLVKGAHKGEGLGNQFLAHIRETDAILHVVRAFEDPKISHPQGRVDPEEDVEVVNTELTLKDLETLEKRLWALQGKLKAGGKKGQKETKTLEKFKELLEKGKFLGQKLGKEEALLAQGLSLLTAKPVIYLVNTGEEKRKLECSFAPCLTLPLKLELELQELSQKEAEELRKSYQTEPGLDKVVTKCYQALDLITFYTIAGGQETRAWTLTKDQTAYEAAGKVHSDFQEKFIKAEVIPAEQLLGVGSWQKARERGLLRTEGRDYHVQDGDVIEFKI